jgi:hypothetical protein
MLSTTTKYFISVLIAQFISVPTFSCLIVLRLKFISFAFQEIICADSESNLSIYECNLCNENFSKDDNLKEHLKQFHLISAKSISNDNFDSISKNIVNQVSLTSHDNFDSNNLKEHLKQSHFISARSISNDNFDSISKNIVTFASHDGCSSTSNEDKVETKESSLTLTPSKDSLTVTTNAYSSQINQPPLQEQHLQQQFPVLQQLVVQLVPSQQQLLPPQQLQCCQQQLLTVQQQIINPPGQPNQSFQQISIQNLQNLTDQTISGTGPEPVEPQICKICSHCFTTNTELVNHCLVFHEQF